jgi:DNA-binding beta-propeller fold protein YncE
VDPSWPAGPPSASWAAVPGVAVDEDDGVWVFTRANPPVRRYDSRGKYLGGWGDEHIRTAHHLRIDPDGNIWLTDIELHVVLKFTKEGKLLQTLGTSGKPGNDSKHFNKPTDVAVSPTGDIFVSDGYGNQRVVHFDREGKFIKAWGSLGTGPGQFAVPHSIALDSVGRIYVGDRENARVQVFNQEGRFLSQWKHLVIPWGLWITKSDEVWVCGSTPMPTGKDGKINVAPPRDQVFMKFNTAGTLLQLWTIPKGADGKEQPGELNWLHALALDSAGNIYTGEINGKRSQKFLLQP